MFLFPVRRCHREQSARIFESADGQIDGPELSAAVRNKNGHGTAERHGRTDASRFSPLQHRSNRILGRGKKEA